MSFQMIGLQVIYLANILVTGWISSTCLFFPEKAATTIFTGAFAFSESFRLVGALWVAIFVLSLMGLFYPVQMSLILVFQLIYKSIWLFGVAFPAWMQNLPFPRVMAVFFIIWIFVLPWIIPWKQLF